MRLLLKKIGFMPSFGWFDRRAFEVEVRNDKFEKLQYTGSCSDRRRMTKVNDDVIAQCLLSSLLLIVPCPIHVIAQRLCRQRSKAANIEG